jgi:glutamate 5-kinase
LFLRSAKKHGQQSLGRSRGGFSTKIHLATDALGNAIRFILTGGERNDIKEAASLIENLSADYVLADKGLGFRSTDSKSRSTRLNSGYSVQSKSQKAARN